MKSWFLAFCFSTLATGAFAQTLAPPAGPLDLPAVGRCVWDKLTEPQRAAFTAAADTQNREAMATALNALRSRDWFNLIDQCDERATTDDNVLAVISAIMVQEGDGVLVRRATNLTREQLDAAIVAAPAESKAALESIVHDKRAGRPSPAGSATTAVTPIARALNIPEVEKFMTAPPGQRLVAYCLDYFQTRVAAAEGNPR